MAIYAVQGLYAARCIGTIYGLFSCGLSLAFFPKPENSGEAKGFVDIQAKEMKVGKEIVVIEGECYGSYGNTWLPGKVVIEVPENGTKNAWKFSVTHEIAHIKFNDHLIRCAAALFTTLFTTFVLAVNRDLFTRYLGGLGVGLITQMVLNKRAERRADQEAMRHCSREVNQAYLDRMLTCKGNENDNHCFLGRWIFCLFNPSLDEKIGYLQEHLQLQKTV